MAEEKHTDLALHDQTGALLMLNKHERKLLRELLEMTLKSKNAREWIIKKLGNEYIEIGESLLKAMGGK
ncbi:MAG: hypothetical protein A2Z39_02055 [Deltaproteobacteria bacterium RBG_19FT_COMBO_46_9]|jgi:hypothetical protein|nr:MAG: hypothetical protein A2Z39_02055 [Deltaproteobacteria bacterium RBG_19FT_COMBO_46_9]